MRQVGAPPHHRFSDSPSQLAPLSHHFQGFSEFGQGRIVENSVTYTRYGLIITLVEGQVRGLRPVISMVKKGFD
jgi:hypothetical protein